MKTTYYVVRRDNDDGTVDYLDTTAPDTWTEDKRKALRTDARHASRLAELRNVTIEVYTRRKAS